MHDRDAAPLLAPLPPDERFESWHLVLADGSVTGRGAGLVGLLTSMQLTRPAGGVLAAVPDKALDTLYGFLAGHRNRLGPLVPNGRAPKRYP